MYEIPFYFGIIGILKWYFEYDYRFYTLDSTAILTKKSFLLIIHKYLWLITINHGELLENWERLQSGHLPYKIAPLK